MRASGTESITFYLNPNAFTVGAKVLQIHVSAILLKSANNLTSFCVTGHRSTIFQRKCQHSDKCLFFWT